MDFILKLNSRAKGILFCSYGEDHEKVPFIAHTGREIFDHLHLDKNHRWKESFDQMLEHEFYALIEIKPSFDRDNMIRLFTVNQKWIMHQCGLYVNKVITTPRKYKPKDKAVQWIPSSALFKRTFIPDRYVFCDKTPGKTRKINFPFDDRPTWVRKMQGRRNK